MPIVVADSSPLQYLVLIEQIELLPQLFNNLLVPDVVMSELNQARTPALVRDWVAQRPTWLRIAPALPLESLPLPKLDKGERAAIALALSLGANLMLMDDRAGVAAALAQGIESIGTLGVLDRAARLGLVDLAASLTRLKATNFRYRPELLDALLAQHKN